MLTLVRPPITFRPYQRKAIQAALDRYALGKRKMVIGLPTGAGKTLTAIGLCTKFLHRSQYALILVPRLDLVTQTQEAFLDFCWIDEQGNEHTYAPDDIGVIQQEHNDLGRHITIASKDTLDNPSRLQQYLDSIPGGKCALVIIDECHYGSIEGYQRLIDATLLPDYGLLIGVSATPFRSDGQSLLKLFPDDFCHTEDIWDLILDGYLADVTAENVCLDPPFDLEIQCKALGLSTDQRHLYRYAKAYAEWITFAAGKRTIIFANDIGDAYRYEEYFTLKGHVCSVVTAKTPAYKRQEIYQSYKAGTILFLISVGVLIMGNDIKEIECVLIARKTDNIGVLTQMVGRGLRLAPSIGKDRMILLNGSGFDITLMMFKRLIGSTKQHIPSLRRVLQEKREEEEEQEAKELPPPMQELSLSLAATGREFNPFHGGGWYFDEVQKEYRKQWQLKSKTHTLIAKRLFAGGYQTFNVDEKGNSITISEQLLTKFDAIKICQQYSVEQQTGSVRGPDPRELDEPITDRMFKRLRNQRVPMRPSGVPWERRMTGEEYERVKAVLKKRHYYEIAAFLDKAHGPRSEEYGNIYFTERDGVTYSKQHGKKGV